MYKGVLWPSSVQCHFEISRYNCLKMVWNSKMAGRTAKRIDIWDSWVVVIYVYVVFWPFTVQSHFGANRWTSVANRWSQNAMQVENGWPYSDRAWNLGLTGTIHLLVFKVILGSFNALASNWPVPRNWLAVEQKGVQFWDSGVVAISIYLCIYTFDFILVSKVILGSFGVLVSKMACSSKTADRRAKQVKCGTLGLG